MRQKIKKLVSLLICAAMIIAITAVASFALPSVPNCLNPIEIDSSTDSIDNLSSQGWSWNKSTHTLTIDGMYQQFNEDGKNSIDFGESNTDINIVIKIFCK